MAKEHAVCLEKEKKKVGVPSEAAYFLSIAILSFAVSLMTAANFGISMVVAPAYLLSLKVGVITFGQAEYIIQGMLFIAMCIILKRFRAVYLMSFLTCVLYGAVLDLWRRIPFLNPDITPPGSMGFPIRIGMFLVGIVLSSFSVELSFKTYLYPQVNDFFVKAVSQRYGIKLAFFKTANDITYFVVDLIMTFGFFGSLKAIGVGTVVVTLCNGTLIGFFSNTFDRLFDFRPCLKRFSDYFETEDSTGERNR